ncbi:MAG: alpha-L-rhamnosidase C-terminal domain-containing protein [Planctomycetia bacterium]|nr:alpha-L-rhamnosidase C-terminal domain-containing protein [Planctomycetia bacterium]
MRGTIKLLLNMTMCVAAFVSPFVFGGVPDPPVALHNPPVADFAANWITPPGNFEGIPNLWIAFRKSVSIDSVPEKANCRIACDSKYWLYVNGQIVVREGALKRGPTPHGTYFDTVDLKPYLTKGSNTVAVLVWYFGKNGFSHLSSGQPGLLFDATGNGPNGLKLLSDASWKVSLCTAVPKGIKLLNERKRTFNVAEFPAGWREKSTGPFEIVTEGEQPNIRLPEWNIRFDARYDFNGDWKANNFDDSAWSAAVECGVPANKVIEPWGELYPRPIPQWKDYGLKEFPNGPKFPLVSDGTAISCRMPYNAQVNPWFKIEAKAGQTIDVRMDNYLGGTEPNIRAEYVTRDGVQEFEVPAWINGHAVIYTFPKGVKVLDLKYRETGYNTEFGNNFQCDDEFYNRLWKKAARTLYITMRDNYFDCPDRERAQWWGDAVNELGEAFYAADRKADLLPRKGFYELIRFQRADHVIFSPIPGYYHSELPAQMLATVGPFGLGTWSFYSGDDSVAADLYPGVKKYLDLWELDDKGLVKVRKGDWSWGDWGKDIDLRPLLNCWYYLAVTEALRTAKNLGLKDDVAHWQSKLKSVRGAFNAEFWTGADYRDPAYKGRSDDRTNAMAVLCGFPAPDKYPTLREHFKKEKNASPDMEKYVLEALCRMGYAQDALDRMKERFTKMVDHPDYTTLWEGWGIGKEGYGGGTINHAWSGGGLTCLAQYIAGLIPVEPAFRSFAVIPQMGNLKKIDMSTWTHYGKIVLSLEKTDKAFSVKITVPPETVCFLGVPDGYRVEQKDANIFTAATHKYRRVTLSAGEHNLVFPAGKNTDTDGARSDRVLKPASK